MSAHPKHMTVGELSKELSRLAYKIRRASTLRERQRASALEPRFNALKQEFASRFPQDLTRRRP